MSVEESIRRLIDRPRRGSGRLPPAPVRAALPESKASAYPADSPAGGIASPITEKKISAGGGSYEASRAYVQDGGSDKIHLLTSTDGLYTFEYKLLEQIEMEDANGEDVTFIYQEVDPDTGAAYDDP